MLQTYKITVVGEVSFDPEQEGPETLQALRTGRVPSTVALKWLDEDGDNMSATVTFASARCNRVLHHGGGKYSCLREMGHKPDEHLFQLADVDTQTELM